MNNLESARKAINLGKTRRNKSPLIHPFVSKTKLEVGDRVIGQYYEDECENEITYKGTVFSVNGQHATINRDDNEPGGGDWIPNKKMNGWLVQKTGKAKTEKWMSNGSAGKPLLIQEKS